MVQKILITGASGLVGTRLTTLLLQKGYQVFHLGRSSRSGAVPSFVWDVENGTMDVAALKGIDAIIHLAGAGVADKRWNQQRKKEILDSRINSTRLLGRYLRQHPHQVQTIVSASAIGIYGFRDTKTMFTEEGPYADDFLAHVVKEWEASVDQLQSERIRVAKLRIGIVLSDKGGALVEMARPVNWGVGTALGSGQQPIAWIHLDDLCNMFIHAIENNNMRGAYNAANPNWVSNMELTKSIAKVLQRPLWLPPVPSFVLKLLVGEMAEIVLGGSRVSADKILHAGFRFQYETADDAIRDLLKKAD